MSRMTRLAFCVGVLAAGVSAGCKSSNCSSCNAQAPRTPVLGERARTVAAAPRIDANIQRAAATLPADDCKA